VALFVINNRQHFEVNTEIHDINTRTKFDLLLKIKVHAPSGKGLLRVHISVLPNAFILSVFGTYRGEHRPRFFENWVLRGIPGCKMGEVTGGMQKVV
jgi:hypothetical protein